MTARVSAIVAALFIPACASISVARITPDAARDDAALLDSGIVDSAGFESSETPADVTRGFCTHLGDGAAFQACNNLQNVAPMISVACGSSPPPMTGGTITDGTYVLSAETRYGCGDAGLDLLSATASDTISIQGTCLQRSGSFPTQSMGKTTMFPITGTSTLMAQGNSLMLALVCASTDDGLGHSKATYTATPLTLSILYPFVSPMLRVYTRM